MAFNAPGTSIFGQPKAGTGPLFGQTPSTTPKPQGSIFGNTVPNISSFGTQTQAQPSGATGTGLFGGQQQPAQQTQPIQPPTLFGQPAQTTQPQAGGMGLFGNPQPTSMTSGLFSQPSSTQNQVPAAAQPSTFGGFGGFGSNMNATSFANPPITQQLVTGGFGPGAAGATTGGSSFGSSTGNLVFNGTLPTAANPPNTGTSLFGNTNATISTNSLFGGAPVGTSSLLGGQSATSSLFGNRQPSQQPSTAISASAAQGNPPFTRSTRFNDLPDQVKKVLEDIDTHIQGRVQICNELKQKKLGDEANKGQELIREVHKDLLHTITVLQSDILQTRAFKAKSDRAVQDTIAVTRIVDGFRNPQQGGAHLKNYADFPLEFFSRNTEEMKEKLVWCKQTIEAIERKLSSIASQTPITPQAITTTLEAQHATFITLASRTAAVNAELQKVKALYTQLWRTKTGSMRDPFNDLDRGTGNEFGLEGLSAAPGGVNK